MLWKERDFWMRFELLVGVVVVVVACVWRLFE